MAALQRSKLVARALEPHVLGRDREVARAQDRKAKQPEQAYRVSAHAQNSAANGPCGSASACRRSAAQRAKASIMLLRVDACRRCSGASQLICAPNASAMISPVSGGKISHGTASVVAKNSRSQCAR